MNRKYANDCILFHFCAPVVCLPIANTVVVIILSLWLIGTHGKVCVVNGGEEA